MAAAAGYVSEPAYELYDVTGAAEDWNYFNQYAYVYTIEIGGTATRARTRRWSSTSTTGCGTRRGCAGDAPGRRGRGLRTRPRAAARPGAGGAHAATDADGALADVVRAHGDGRAGTVEGPVALLAERFRSTLQVPASGRFRWHVNPSTRPLAELAGRKETWTLRCGSERRRVVVGVAQMRVLQLTCDG